MDTEIRYSKLVGFAARLIGALLMAGLAGATLIWFAPGLESSEHQLNPALSQESVRRIDDVRMGQTSVGGFYLLYLRNALQGDLGVSRTFGRPNTELLAERAPVTVGSVGGGLAIGWIGGLALATAGVFTRSLTYRMATTVISGALLCVPAALIALACFRSGLPAAFGIAAVIFPKVFRYSSELLQASLERDHVLAARAKGLSPARVLVWHVAPSALPQLAALAGVSLSIGLGAAIPVEVLCDSPGIGQLAWRAALGRDLPLLVGLTLVITAVTVAANLLADAGVPEART